MIAVASYCILLPRAGSQHNENSGATPPFGWTSAGETYALSAFRERYLLAYGTILCLRGTNERQCPRSLWMPCFEDVRLGLLLSGMAMMEAWQLTLSLSL